MLEHVCYYLYSSKHYMKSIVKFVNFNEMHGCYGVFMVAIDIILKGNEVKLHNVHLFKYMITIANTHNIYKHKITLYGNIW